MVEDIESKSRITFKFIHEKRIDILRNSEKVGEIWSWIPSNDFHEKAMYPYSEKERDYTEKNGIQICGFSEISSVWDCGKFKDKKDVVVTFKDNIK